MKHSRTTALQALYRLLVTLLTVAAVGFIFSNSMEAGSLSSSRSGTFTALLNGVLGQLGLPTLTEHVVRKLAHFSEFCLLGFLLSLCVWAYSRRVFRYLCWPLLLGLLVADLDETIQLYSIDRTSSVVDVWIDFGGVCVGVAVALGLRLLGTVLLRLMGFGQKKKRG
jgi:VanZ family protein